MSSSSSLRTCRCAHRYAYIHLTKPMRHSPTCVPDASPAPGFSSPRRCRSPTPRRTANHSRRPLPSAGASNLTVRRGGAQKS
jgi:hypothetical protein